MKKIHIALLLAFALVFILGCQLVTGAPSTEPVEPVSVPNEPATNEEPAAAPTQAPTLAPQPTTPPAAASQSGDLIFQTDFPNIDDWEVIAKNQDGYNVQLRGNGLYVEVPKDFDFWYAYAPIMSYEDVRIEADVQLVGGTNYTYITLTCRSSEAGEYVFFMDTGGYWQIGKYVFGDNSTYERLAEGGSNKIKVAKNPNHIAAVCKGAKLTMYINGSEVGSVEDAHLSSGIVGVGVETFDYPLAQVMFHNLEVYIP